MTSRRHFLAACAAAPLLAREALGSTVSSQGTKPSLRVLGTHVTLQDKIRLKAEADLGLALQYEPGGSARVLHKASTQPEAFDVYEQWSDSIHILWDAGAIQPIEVARIPHWDAINPLAKTGKLTPDALIGAGDSPCDLLFVQSDGTLGSNPTDKISYLPYVHNADSFGYDTRSIPRGVPYETESWGWLLKEEHHGKVALVNSPSIGLFDAALATQALGLASFQDIGKPNRAELDSLFDVLIDLKRDGHFRGVWSSVSQSVALMERNEVVVESMFSPAVASLNGKGIPCVYAAPKEGYRGWHGVMCLSTASDGEAKDAAYDYMNWWISGWAGAHVARQGYYISTPQLSRPHLSPAEWDYWYEGKPAAMALKSPDGSLAIRPGEVRSGGSYETRFSRIAVWNTVIREYEYSVGKWSEFLLA